VVLLGRVALAACALITVSCGAPGSLRPVHELPQSSGSDASLEAGVEEEHEDSCFDVRTIDRQARPIPNALVVATTHSSPAQRIEARSNERGVAALCVPGEDELALGA